MIFEDIFYPGNREKRQQIADLQAESRRSFESFKEAWNQFANILNPCFDEFGEKEFAGVKNYSEYKLKNLSYNIKTDNVTQCLHEINDAVESARNKLDKFIKDINLEQLLPNNLSVDLFDEHSGKVRRALLGLPSVTLSSFATYYTYHAVRIVITIVNLAGATISSLMEILGGIAGGLIVGGVAFIVSDAIIGAINGAIERKELEDAVDVLKKFKEKVSDPLREAGDKIRGILQSIKDGVYILSDDMMLVRTKDGTYKVVKKDW
jgi:hypothetical protein